MQLATFGEIETAQELNKFVLFVILKVYNLMAILNRLRGFMKEQDRTHTEGLAEIQCLYILYTSQISTNASWLPVILDSLLETGYLEHLKKQGNTRLACFS